jgi:hypothetical protein
MNNRSFWFMALQSSGELLSISLQNVSPWRLIPLPVLVSALVNAKAKISSSWPTASGCQPIHMSHSLKKYYPVSRRLFSDKQHRSFNFI